MKRTGQTENISACPVACAPIIAHREGEINAFLLPQAAFHGILNEEKKPCGAAPAGGRARKEGYLR